MRNFSRSVQRAGSFLPWRYVVFACSSVLSALCSSLILGGTIGNLESGVAVFLATFIGIQNLAVTIVKWGADQIVFAAVSAEPHIRPDLRALTKRTIMPAAALTALLLSFFYDVRFLAAAIVCAVVDSLSVVRLGELNAKKRFGRSAVAALLNYPLFFLLVIFTGCLRPLSYVDVVIFFTLSSLIRFAALLEKRVPGGTRVAIQVPLIMGAQQLLNLLLFRSDSLLIGGHFLLASSQVPGAISVETSRALLYLTRFSELISAAVSLAGVYFFPRIPIEPGATFAQLRSKKGILVVTAASATIWLLLLCYMGLWNGEFQIPLLWLLATGIQAHFIFPANLLTFSMLRGGNVSTLCRNLLFVCAIGLSLCAFALYSGNPYLFPLVVNLQLALFMLLGTFGSWGQGRRWYEP